MGHAALSGRLAVHLVRRFVGALDPRGPDAAEEGWALDHLTAGERALWRRMSGPDRRHAVQVARAVVADLGAGTSRPVVAAALLHDVGKVEARLGTVGRVPATLAGLVVGRARTARWDGRVGRYLRHDAIGGALLAAAGSDPLTVAWATEHHLPPQRWSLPADVAAALKAADDD